MQKEFANFSRNGELRAIPQSAPASVRARILEIRSKMRAPAKSTPTATLAEPEIDRARMNRMLQVAAL
jgi:hypothetical protein